MIRRKVTLAFGSAMALLLGASCGNARASGYLPDDGADDRAAIQAEIDRVATAGGGTVQLESGTYDISGPLFMRSGVTLAGRGPETLITTVAFNSRSDWSGVVIFAGTLTPGSYDDNDGFGYAGVPAVPASDTSVTLPGCDPARIERLPGEIVWLSTVKGVLAKRDLPRPEYGVMNSVTGVDGCTVTFSDTLGIPAGNPFRLHWADGSKRQPKNVGEPNLAIRNATVTDLRLETANSSAMLVTGCYRCAFTNLTMERTRRLFSVQGTRFSHYRNIRGNFTERGIEFATHATHNRIEDVRGRYLPGTSRAPRPAIRFGEYARDNTLSDVVLELGPAYSSTDKIRFDESGGNRLENVRLVVSPGGNGQLHIYRGPDAARGNRDVLPPGTELVNVTLCIGENETSCEPAG